MKQGTEAWIFIWLLWNTWVHALVHTKSHLSCSAYNFSL